MNESLHREIKGHSDCLLSPPIPPPTTMGFGRKEIPVSGYNFSNYWLGGFGNASNRGKVLL